MSARQGLCPAVGAQTMQLSSLFGPRHATRRAPPKMSFTFQSWLLLGACSKRTSERTSAGTRKNENASHRDRNVSRGPPKRDFRRFRRENFATTLRTRRKGNTSDRKSKLLFPYRFRPIFDKKPQKKCGACGGLRICCFLKINHFDP